MWNKRMGVLGFGCLREHCRLSGFLCCVAQVVGAVIVGLVLLCPKSANTVSSIYYIYS